MNVHITSEDGTFGTVQGIPQDKTINNVLRTLAIKNPWKQYLTLYYGQLIFYHNGQPVSRIMPLRKLCQGLGASNVVSCRGSQAVVVSPQLGQLKLKFTCQLAPADLLTHLKKLNSRCVGAPYDCLSAALFETGFCLVDVPGDHRCLYAALLHAFCTQLVATHPARVEAEMFMQEIDPAVAFKTSLLKYPTSDAAKDAMKKPWSPLEETPIGNWNGEIWNPTAERTADENGSASLEDCILRTAEKLDFGRKQCKTGKTLEALLSTMLEPTTWGSELVLAFLVPLKFDVQVHVVKTGLKTTVASNGQGPGKSTKTSDSKVASESEFDSMWDAFNIPQANSLHYQETEWGEVCIRMYPSQYSVTLACYSEHHFTSSLEICNHLPYAVSWESLVQTCKTEGSSKASTSTSISTSTSTISQGSQGERAAAAAAATKEEEVGKPRGEVGQPRGTAAVSFSETAISPQASRELYFKEGSSRSTRSKKGNEGKAIDCDALPEPPPKKQKKSETPESRFGKLFGQDPRATKQLGFTLTQDFDSFPLVIGGYSVQGPGYFDLEMAQQFHSEATSKSLVLISDTALSVQSVCCHSSLIPARIALT